MTSFMLCSGPGVQLETSRKRQGKGWTACWGSKPAFIYKRWASPSLCHFSRCISSSHKSSTLQRTNALLALHTIDTDLSQILLLITHFSQDISRTFPSSSPTVLIPHLQHHSTLAGSLSQAILPTKHLVLVSKVLTSPFLAIPSL